jgi:hypothetical protein
MREFYYKNKLVVLLILIVVTFIVHLGIYKLDFKLLVETLLFAFIAFIFFDWVANVTTKKELFENLFKMMKNHNDNVDMGFERVILNAGKIDYKELINKSSNIYICQIYGRQWLGNYKRAIIDKLQKDPNTKIHFLIYDKENVSVEGYSYLFSDGDKEKLAHRIQESLDICVSIQEQRSKQVKITVVKDRPFTGAIYIFDDTLIQIPLSISKKDFSNFIAYEFEKTTNENDGYKVFKAQVDELLEN